MTHNGNFLEKVITVVGIGALALLVAQVAYSFKKEKESRLKKKEEKKEVPAAAKRRTSNTHLHSNNSTKIRTHHTVPSRNG